MKNYYNRQYSRNYCRNKKQMHGTSLIISEDVMKETKRLCKLGRGIEIEPINLLFNKEVILNISSIDGVIMMDENCISCGVGLIVDGEAIVVSEDGMVDVLHTV